MPRNIKNPVERRNEFIAVAEELFLENGFENTSIDDIVIRMNVAKGLFYHYFDSKDELLTAIAERLLDEIRSRSFWPWRRRASRPWSGSES